jgi:hypothetical protein
MTGGRISPLSVPRGRKRRHTTDRSAGTLSPFLEEREGLASVSFCALMFFSIYRIRGGLKEFHRKMDVDVSGEKFAADVSFYYHGAQEGGCSNARSYSYFRSHALQAHGPLQSVARQPDAFGIYGRQGAH